MLALILVGGAFADRVESGALETANGVADGCESHIRFGAPSDESELLCRLAYAAAHDDEAGIPSWVAYRVTRDRLEGPVDRTNDFRADPDLDLGRRAELADYRGSGYDRGHMMPAGKNRWSTQAMSESFLLSNIAPQVGNGFNRHIWANLESWIRDCVTMHGELYVVTGPAFVGGPLDRIGDNAIPVPTHYFKVIFDPVRIQALAFLLPNTALPSPSLPAYVTSVRHVERLTGLDFHNRIQPEIQDLIETDVPEMACPGE